MTSACRPGVSWEPLDGDLLWLANGQYFSHEISVDEPFPVGTTSWLAINGILGHFINGVLSSDRLTFTYTLAPPGSDDTVVPDRAQYEFWVVVPNTETLVDEPWKWFVGEVRRKD